MTKPAAAELENPTTTASGDNIDDNIDLEASNTKTDHGKPGPEEEENHQDAKLVEKERILNYTAAADPQHEDASTPQQDIQDVGDLPQPLPTTSLRRERNAGGRGLSAPGAVAVAGHNQSQTQQQQGGDTPTQDATPTATGPTDVRDHPNIHDGQHLLEAHLVEDDSQPEDDNMVRVEATPAKTGIHAIISNPHFKYVAAFFILVLLVIVVPLALIQNNDSNSNSQQNDDSDIAMIADVVDDEDPTLPVDMEEEEPPILQPLESNNETTPEADEHCGTAAIYYADYRGFVAETVSGLTCQAWDSQFPHSHTRTKENYPDAGLEGNFCRNPDGEPLTWCYTNLTHTRWEVCIVPQCKGDQEFTNSECGRLEYAQAEYRGNISVTTTGKTCQPWDSHNPNFNLPNPEEFPEGGLVENYCRNPNRRDRAYCLTTDNNTSWESCNVPWCDENGNVRDEDDYVIELQNSENLFLVVDALERTNYFESTNHDYSKCGTAKLLQSDYRGNVSVTVSGRECQPWDAKSPHSPNWVSHEYPTVGLAENYCRNPSVMYLGAATFSAYTWCYTMDPLVRWEYCNVDYCQEEMQFHCGPDAALPDCQEECGTKELLQQDYRGNISTTMSGIECASWAETLPHRNASTSTQGWSDKDLASNHCRNPDGWPGGRAWCYTTAEVDINYPNYDDLEIRWEACSVPMC